MQKMKNVQEKNAKQFFSKIVIIEMKLGKFDASLVPFLTATVTIGSIIIIYFIAVYLGHEKPLPHTWISRTAQHYPQYIIFRVGTISGAVLMILSYFINHFIIMQKAYDNIFSIHKYHPQVILIMGTMGAIFLMGSTALIDTGKMNGDLHVFCAGNTFLWSILANWYNAYISWVMHKKGKIGSKFLTWTRIGLAFLILVQAIQDLRLSSLSYGEQVAKNPMTNVYEYTIAFSVMGTFILTGFEAKRFQLVYDSK